jgi:hypothetical protein
MNDSSDDSDNYSEQEMGIKEDDDESKPVSKKEEAEDDYSQEQDDYESTPSQMKKDKQEEGQGEVDEEEDNYEDQSFDDKEMIDTAERIFVRMAELMFDNQITCRQAFRDHIFVADFEG